MTSAGTTGALIAGREAGRKRNEGPQASKNPIPLLRTMSSKGLSATESFSETASDSRCGNAELQIDARVKVKQLLFLKGMDEFAKPPWR
jgi:hypothetical protein